MAASDVYWRLHFVLGLIHQNRSAELERLAILSAGQSDPGDVHNLLRQMVDFAEKGFG